MAGVCFQFDKINVTSIEQSAGIFIGHNQMLQWHSQMKINSIFANATNSSIHQNLNVLYDNDMMDVTVDARDVSNTTKNSTNELTKVDFNSINVGEVDMCSSIAIGENLQNSWGSTRKSNVGIGESDGITAASENVNVISDNDLIDMPIDDRDFKPGFQMKG